MVVADWDMTIAILWYIKIPALEEKRRPIGGLSALRVVIFVVCYNVCYTGRDRINRALDGDIVAVELIQPDEASKPSIISLHPSEMAQTNVSIAEETAVPTAADIEGLRQTGGRLFFLPFAHQLDR